MFCPSNHRPALLALSRELGVSPDAIEALIYAESKWNPTVKNPLPGSSARGLIQFLDKTAQGMGYASSLDLVTKHRDISSQLLGPVRRFFLRQMPFANDSDFIIANFQPSKRKNPHEKVPPSVSKKNGGVKTWDEYARRVIRLANDLARRRSPTPVSQVHSEA